MSGPTCEPDRVIADLLALEQATGGRGEGSRRIAWGEEWRKARALLGEALAGLPVETRQDAAGNLWTVLPGERPEALILGSHLDSVPAGGWLDGALGVFAGAEALRSFARCGTPPVTIGLVDWADEEGARFGAPLFGSSAACGHGQGEALRGRRDVGQAEAAEVLAANGVELAGLAAAAELPVRGRAYLELHIEQGPRLESLGVPVAAVTGTVGFSRATVTLRGRAAHAGTTPLDARADALVAAARLILALREQAEAFGGVATVGTIEVPAGAINTVPAEVVLALDQRHGDPEALARMVTPARDFVAAGIDVSWREISSRSPVAFDESLTEIVARACREECGTAVRLESGALHDATEMATRMPTSMVFVPSRAGLSHNPLEDTDPEDLRAGVRTLCHAAWAAAAAI
ncbi:MAG: hydantoinase/carbamoylase family amidase [Actinobacteria bacterium]|nr:hydantoinase/carbamoylase family amidase [Actinomycetota bacterium]